MITPRTYQTFFTTTNLKKLAKSAGNTAEAAIVRTAEVLLPPVIITACVVGYVPLKMVQGLSFVNETLIRNAAKLYPNPRTTLIYYTLAGAAISFYGSECLFSVLGYFMESNMTSQFRKKLIANETSCWQQVGNFRQFNSGCENDVTLSQMFTDQSHLMALQQMPSIDAFVRTSRLFGMALGTFFGFMLGLLTEGQEQRERKERNETEVTLKEAVDKQYNRIKLDVREFSIMAMAVSMGLCFPLMVSVASQADERFRLFFKFGSDQVGSGNYPNCEVHYKVNDRDICSMISCSDKNAAVALCQAGMNHLYELQPFWKMRFVQAMAMSIPVARTVGFFKVVSERQRWMEYENAEKNKKVTSNNHRGP